ncbi:MAG: cytochrome c family protein [Sphingomonadaceae bacterium]|nr:cytochrome c family protein [Sphingomonadaceae bacterium]
MQLSLSHILLVASLGALAACGPKPADGGQGATPTASATPAAPTAPAAPAAPAGDFVVAGLHGDATRGATIFNQCRACHALNPGQNGIGPTLHAVVGRSAGTVAGYSYSTANKTSHRVWDKDTLFAYLESPMMMIPGTKMTFRLADAQARADVIAYLATQN